MNNNGKGDSPRNCFSKKFRENYDSIIWNPKKKEEQTTLIKSITGTPITGINITKLFSAVIDHINE